MNRRGSMISLYSVVLAVVMCGLVLWGYAHHQGSLSGAVVSPLKVLETVNRFDVFEAKEEVLIRKSLDGVSFGEQGFESEFLYNFVNGIDVEMRQFVMDGLYYDGVFVSEESSFPVDSFFRNGLYSVEVRGGDLVLKRSGALKRFDLEASRDSDVSFPVSVYFDFSGEYLISKEGNEILVRKL